MRFVIEDANFIVSLMYKGDKYYYQALQAYKVLDSVDPLTYIVSDIALNESIFTLIKIGVAPDRLRERINNFTMVPRIIMHNTDVMTTLRYTSSLYNELLHDGRSGITKANDFLIACVAKDYPNPLVITADKQMQKALKGSGIEVFNFADDGIDTLRKTLES